MRPLPSALTVSLLSLLLVGCSESTSSPSTPSSHQTGQHEHDEHAEHDHPETLEEGLKELTELRDTVRDAFAADDVDTAHGPLHDVGHLLEDITGLVDSAELTPEQRKLAKQNIDSLFDLFGGVDRALHGEDGTTYKQVSGKIDAAIAALQGIAAPGDTRSTTGELSEAEGNQSTEE